jgi:hypothetical protein
LFEGDFTQSIKDNGYVLENAPTDGSTFGVDTATLDVVGIFNAFGYSPIPPSPIPAPPEYGFFPYNSYQARFAEVVIDEGGQPRATLLKIDSTGDDRNWPSKLLMFCSGAPTLINQYLDPSRSTGNVGNSLYVESTAAPGTYVQIPASTRQTMLTPLSGTDEGWILAGSVTVPYQAAASGLTVTNGVQVTGYYVNSVPLQRETLYFQDTNGDYIQATGALMIDVIGKGQVNGPSLYSFNPFAAGEAETIPIVVNESTFGDYLLNDYYSFTDENITFVVVGLWANQAPPAAPFAAPLSEPAVERNAAPAPEPTPPLDIKALFAETGAKLRARRRR